MRLLTNILVAPALALTSPASAQSLEDLERLSDAVWTVSLAETDDMARAARIVEELFPDARLTDVSDRTLDRRWIGLAYGFRTEIPSYSQADAVSCTVLSNDGVSVLADILERFGHDATDHLPRPIHQFTYTPLSNHLSEETVSLQACIGAFHPRSDRVAYDNWHLWYDELERKFTNSGLTTSRDQSPSDTYMAGFLSARGMVCNGGSCLIAAAPFSVNLSAHMNTNQTTITVGSVILDESKTEP